MSPLIRECEKRGLIEENCKKVKYLPTPENVFNEVLQMLLHMKYNQEDVNACVKI
jgi:hypothetical protein